MTVELRHGEESIRALAEATARASAVESLHYRELFAAAGGAYLPIDHRNVPDPVRMERGDRDLVALNGQRQILVPFPALLAMIHGNDPQKSLIQLSIKNLQPLGPEDTPDAWEKKALSRLRGEQPEVSELISVAGDKPSLRFMYPVFATAGCVKNRPDQNLKVGDLLGGISISLPMAAFEGIRKQHSRLALGVHGIIWLLGAAGIALALWRMQQGNVALVQAEAETRAAKEELEKIFDSIGEIITIQDREMRVIGANKAACLLLNAQAEELIGRHCYEVFRGADAPCRNCPEVVALKDGKVHRAEIEHANLHKQFVVSASPMMDEEGRVVRIVHCAHDLTEKKNLERQLRQAQKMEAVGTLASGIAHDFNNILAAVIGFSELAMLDIPRESPAQADLEQVLRASMRAKELVRQILTFSRQSEQNVQAIRLQPILQESLALLRASIPTTIELRQQIDGKCGDIIADPIQMQQVIMNLCANAYHAMRKSGGVLGVTLASTELGPEDVVNNKLVLTPGRYVLLSISDTGSGIAPEFLDRIFEPYFTTKAKGEGTGLGLSVVHGIAQGLGGHVAVYSKLGRGTTFHVYLPESPCSAEVWPISAVAEVRIPTGNERVLVLDDEESVVFMEQRILTSLGYTVRAFTDCVAAMDEFLRHPDAYDLIITDMNMPKISGAELVEAVRTERPGMPIIMCTGFSEIMNEEKVRQLGIDKLAMKPLTVKELARAVREVLDATP